MPPPEPEGGQSPADVLADAALALGGRGARAARDAVARGRDALASVLALPPGIRPAPGAPPFNDRAWTEQAPWALLRRLHAEGERTLRSLSDSPRLPAHRRPLARFLAQAVADATAPTNFLLTNPAALRDAWHTRGASLARGARHFAQDVRTRQGRPARMPPGSFRIGADLAATPGRVVHRNELLELLQYSPRTPRVHEVPLLLVPPWVNKYYIYDLAPGRSLVEWAVRQGFTVFCISARDHSSSTLDVDLEQFFTDGVLPALDVVLRTCAVRRVGLVGACSGGLFATALADWLAQTGTAEAASLTLLATALTLPEPFDRPHAFWEGEMRLLVELLSRDRRCIDGRKLALAFDLVRSEAQLWEPLTTGWLRGERPRAFDLTAWNDDNLDVPRKLFLDYFKVLAHGFDGSGRLRIAGRDLHPGHVTADTFALAAQIDHIVPWETAYRSTLLLRGDRTFRLVPSGHMGTVVSPPRPRTRHLASAHMPATAAQWRETAVPVEGSWWQGWTDWLAERSGGQVPSRTPRQRPGLAHDRAPGLYALHGWPDQLVQPTDDETPHSDSG
ncbi:alpha/beta fold hydrolase [Streptomyces buecherae]|uniref:PHA/PHB synthase family protein n=1 Tax=Streptomyces buecherae TaxID=2763006 RepID=UPI0034081777